MTEPNASGDAAAGRSVAIGVRAAYDAVAPEYDRQLGDELDAKPLDRALLATVVELVGTGTIADVGCGPGHVTRFVAERHRDMVGIDRSPRMIAVARERAPDLTFTAGSMLQFPAGDGAWSGVVSLYSIIHTTTEERAAASREFARVIARGGWLLVAHDVDSDEFAVGDVNHLTTWFGELNPRHAGIVSGLDAYYRP